MHQNRRPPPPSGRYVIFRRPLRFLFPWHLLFVIIALTNLATIGLVIICFVVLCHFRFQDVLSLSHAKNNVALNR